MAVTSASITKSVSSSAIARNGSSALLAVSISLLASSSRSILSLAIRCLAPFVKVLEYFHWSQQRLACQGPNLHSRFYAALFQIRNQFQVGRRTDIKSFQCILHSFCSLGFWERRELSVQSIYSIHHFKLGQLRKGADRAFKISMEFCTIFLFQPLFRRFVHCPLACDTKRDYD